MSRMWFDFINRQTFETDSLNEVWLIETESLGREGSSADDNSPFLIANEWIAGCIGQFLRFPIPPFALIRRPASKGMFVSLHVSPRKIDTPPGGTDALELIKADPKLSTGILLYDTLIANIDRHLGNIIVDRVSDPKEIYLIDQEFSVFGCYPGGDEFKRLKNLRDHLGISGLGCGDGARRHCLLDCLDTADYINHWFGWIESIPSFYIRAICQEVVGLGINLEQADAAADFLIHRSRNIVRIVQDHRHEFTSIPKAGWGLLL